MPPSRQRVVLKILDTSMDWWEVFVLILSGFYKKIVSKVCQDGKFMKALKEAYWAVTPGIFWILFNESRKVRMQATSAHLASDSKCNCLFLHATIQELCLPKEFEEALSRTTCRFGPRW